MKEKKYIKESTETVIRDLSLPVDKVQKCTGDPEADTENVVLKKEHEDQAGHDSHSDMTILLTHAINNFQCRGLLFFFLFILFLTYLLGNLKISSKLGLEFKPDGLKFSFLCDWLKNNL